MDKRQKPKKTFFAAVQFEVYIRTLLRTDVEVSQNFAHSEEGRVAGSRRVLKRSLLEYV